MRSPFRTALVCIIALALAPRFVIAIESIGVYEHNVDGSLAGCDLSYENDCNACFVPEAYYYVVHTSSAGASGSRWKAELPACAAQVLQYSVDYDVSGFAITGDSQTGMQVDYGGCHTGSILVTLIGCFTMSNGPACCMWPVTAHPDTPSGKVAATDCDGHTTYPIALEHPFDPDGSCDCGTVPVEHTTWGGVKALWSTEE